MEFDKKRIFTAVNADELKPGDIVVVGNTINEIRNFIEERKGAMKCYAEIQEILDDDCGERFKIGESPATGDISYAFAYLIERKENCLNCSTSCMGKSWLADKYTRCDSYKPVDKGEVVGTLPHKLCINCQLYGLHKCTKDDSYIADPTKYFCEYFKECITRTVTINPASKKSNVNWQWCKDPNEINEAIRTQNPNWDGLESAEQIISISYDTNQGCYVIFWQVYEE